MVKTILVLAGTEAGLKKGRILAFKNQFLSSSIPVLSQNTFVFYCSQADYQQIFLHLDNFSFDKRLFIFREVNVISDTKIKETLFQKAITSQ